MDLQAFSLDGSSVLNEDELVLLFGGKDVITKPDENTDKCNKCDKCLICF